MKSNLQFDFLVDKENNTLIFRREFAAERQLVWDCYTKAELLNQWFAPKPLTTQTRHMDFREGGYWFYAMVEPNGTEYCGRTDYIRIQPIDFYKAIDAFANPDGTINNALPRSEWDVTFTDKEENTIVESLITYKSLADLEAVVQMGMQEGMLSCMEKLEEVLSTLKK